MMISLAIALSILIVGSIVFYAACLWFTRHFFAVPPSIEEFSTEGVSILVPVCGLDEGAWNNWVAFCKQDYDTYEVLFGVVEPTDPAVPVLKKLVDLFPDRARLLTGLLPRGINHKDSTLSYLLESARHEVIIFADSDIRVSSDYIQTVTEPLANPNVGLVTCAFVGHDPQFLGAALASIGRCCDFIPSALIARAMDGGLRFAIGATIATRKSRLADFGGLHLDRIGSDYNLGKRAASAGYQVELSHYILESDTGRESIGQLVKRELRWARTIRFNRGWVYYTMVFCYGTVYCLPLLLIAGFADWAIGLTFATFTIRYTQAWVAAVNLNCSNLLRWFWVLPLRDVLSFGVWF
ncbi:MAG: glycosyltransferase, partial [Phormidesmis sp. CAN_BIN44]|nr:glycosyltransferase [Phormidesmis sp. CAN_BIN44]